MALALCCRIVRNKAAEKAKHVHHQQQQQSAGGTGQQQQQQQTGSVSVITHAPASSVQAQQHHPGGHHDPQRPGAYSINGILGIPQQQQADPNGNSITKRKREDHHTGRTLTNDCSLLWQLDRTFARYC